MLRTTKQCEALRNKLKYFKNNDYNRCPIYMASSFTAMEKNMHFTYMYKFSSQRAEKGKKSKVTLKGDYKCPLSF
ncbi:hypothetical protein MKS88_001480 [Plasmodium brasilianum]|uniref:Uncharacterized protein n=1 Tax=Plasmodium brasilianum TaxID=5824 RepID=A0ACB9YCW6_PLABR|nr:hypothetical protein MKS88_001480 [Plasmodium brasilianum]